MTRPDATNTGVPAGTPLTAWSGGSTISTTQTITDKTFTLSRSLLVNAPGVVFQRCRFDVVPPTPGTAGVFWPVDVRRSGLGAVTEFWDCEFDGNGIAGTGPVAPGLYSGFAPSAAVLTGRDNGYRLVRCHIHDFNDGLQLAGRGITVDSCYLHGFPEFWTGAANSHNDGMQASNQGCSNVHIVNNHVDATTGHTCMQIIPNGPNDGTRKVHEQFLIEGNYFNGGGYSLSGYSAAQYAGQNADIVDMAIRDNRFGLDCLFGPSYPGRDPRIAWSGNVWDVSGTTGYGATVTAGQAIA